MADPAPEHLDVSGRDSAAARLSSSAKLFIVLSLILGAGAVSWSAWTYKQVSGLKLALEQRQQTAQEILVLQQQYEDVAKSQSDLLEQLLELDTRAGALDNALGRAGIETEQRLAMVTSELSSEIQKLARNSSQASQFIKLLEVRYLLRTAAIGLHFRQDISATVLLLERVLDQLDALDGLALLPLKAQVKKDLASLQRIENGATNDTLRKLAAIEQAWPNLLPATTLQSSPPVESAESSIGELLLHELSQLIQIRYLSQSDQVQFDANAYLSAIERDLLRLKFDAALTQLRVALMRRDTAAFRDNLNVLKQWHQQFADANSAVTEGNLLALATLEQLDLGPQQYDLSVSIELIDALLDNRK